MDSGRLGGNWAKGLSFSLLGPNCYDCSHVVAVALVLLTREWIALQQRRTRRDTGIDQLHGFSSWSLEWPAVKIRWFFTQSCTDEAVAFLSPPLRLLRCDEWWCLNCAVEVSISCVIASRRSLLSSGELLLCTMHCCEAKLTVVLGATVTTLVCCCCWCHGESANYIRRSHSETHTHNGNKGTSHLPLFPSVLLFSLSSLVSF